MNDSQWSEYVSKMSERLKKVMTTLSVDGKLLSRKAWVIENKDKTGFRLFLRRKDALMFIIENPSY